MRKAKPGMTSVGWIAFAVVLVLGGPAAAETPWKWSGSFGDESVEILILGDIQVQRPEPETAFLHLRDTLSQADLVYANLEGMLVTSRGNGVDIPDKKWIHPGPEGVVALRAAHIEAVGVANNVAYGRDNIMETLQVLHTNGIVTVGSGKNIEEAHRPAILERKGITIGFLQYTARWYREEEQIATESEPGVARITSRDGVTIEPSDLERVREDIRLLRPRVDFMIVSHHNRDGATAVQFGDATESANPTRRAQRPDRTRAEEYQKQFAHVALDTGANLVFGHGTHTVQGVELYQGKPILYAVGHSAFDQPGYETSTDGLVVRIVVQGKKLLRVSFVPVTRDANNNVLMLDPSTGEGARLLGVVQKVSPGLRLKIDGREVVVIDEATAPTDQ